MGRVSKSTADRVKGVILDIDGVLQFQGKVYPGAVQAVRALRNGGLILRFLSNSTLHSRRSRAERLAQMGFTLSPEEVITASYATAEYLRALQPRSVWLMLDGAGREEFHAFVHDEEAPEYIALGDNRSRFNFDTLNKALRLLMRGAKLVAMSPELVDASLGDVELNVGAWALMLERASGVQATYVGKPNAYMFALALATMGLAKDEVIMVGDRLSSDILGANAFGIRSVLVKTGEYALGRTEGDARPDWVLESVADLPALLGLGGETATANNANPRP